MRLRDMKYIGFKHQRENKQNSDKYMLSGYKLIDTENISLPSQNMKFVGE
jgi:hypothetical protein